ncbi:MAG: bifunctional glycosyltransferase/class I SAM-dependent methyltransferase [Ilumatobacteraceae bacterium]
MRDGARSEIPMSRDPRIGVLVVAYNAASTLAAVLDRIPPAFRARIAEVIVSDDASDDATYLVGLGYQQTGSDLPLTVIRQPRNLGYGGNQKAGYRLAMEHDLDVVVLLHGDGQYAPELLPEMVRPLVDGEADAVFGSRMLVKGAARRGGMPLYKYLGNKTLTTMQNALVGTSLSEFHSGYRAYSTAALRRIAFESNSDGFDFDTQIILQLVESGQRLVEIPIPTYYGDEICYVNGVRYGRDVLRHAVDFRLARAGFNAGIGGDSEPYQFKPSATSSHGRIIEWMSGHDSAKVLDVGCASGELGRALRDLGHYVVGVDIEASEGASGGLDEFFVQDLDDGLPTALTGQFDVIVCADALEHLRRPDELLADLHRHLQPGGAVLVSVPNFAHWYPRVRVATGRFDYDRRGILDAGHVRFFTDRTFRRLAAGAGFGVRRRAAVGMPFDAIVGEAAPPADGRRLAARVRRAVRVADRVSVDVYPSMFAYQYVYELVPTRVPAS